MRIDAMRVNISRSMLFDLNFIERASGMQKDKWMYLILAQQIKKEKEKLLEQIEKDFVQERIDEYEFEQMTGYAPCELMQDERKKYIERSNLVLAPERYAKFARKALKMIAPEQM